MQCAVHCAKVTSDAGGMEDFPDDSLSCDPAGAVFEETLEDLNDMDRELFFFSAGGNLAAVRWLFVLGADKFARDSNRTTALHTACRTGTLPIIRELLHQGIALDEVDSSGWTPLHITIFMCRRDSVLCLLRARAPLMAMNSKGQTPLDLCNDTWTREAIRSFMNHSQEFPDRPWQFEKEHEAHQDADSLPHKLLYEPFFVPRNPVITEQAHKQELLALGQLLFNKRPGQGLAFLVASGCTRDYPVDLSFFLRRGRLDLAQIGQFLGENFSLSQTLRLEFINSVKFHGTSIVSGLAKVFTLLQIPPDLQKIDRLVHGVARIWWRQHDRITEEEEERMGVVVSEVDKRGSSPKDRPPPTTSTPSSTKPASEEAELESFDLKQYLVSPETLYQLMFSVVMLHWNLYAPGVDGSDVEDGRISMAKWIEINRGLEADGSDVPIHILQKTYRTVRGGFVPQLTIRVSPPKPTSPRADVDRKGSKGSLVHGSAKLESWAWIAAGINVGATGTTQSNVLSVFSESGTRGQNAVANSRAERKPIDDIFMAIGPGRPLFSDSPWDSLHVDGKDRVWLSLCYTLLFLSTSPGQEEAPYAFVHLRHLNVERSSKHRTTLTLIGQQPQGSPPKGEACNDLDEISQQASSSKVVVVFLLPDGRWQEFELPRLDVEVASEAEREKWVGHLDAVCGKVELPSAAVSLGASVATMPSLATPSRATPSVTAPSAVAAVAPEPEVDAAAATVRSAVVPEAPAAHQGCIDHPPGTTEETQL